MTSVLLMLFVVSCPLLVLSESGDDDWSEIEVTCTSTLTLKQNNLTCSLNDETNEEIISAKLCQKRKMCEEATGPQHFTFENLKITGKYKLEVHLGEEVIEKVIDLIKIVKIPAPEIKLATYTEDGVFIWFEHNHDYVLHPSFQVEIWGDQLANKSIMARYMIRYMNFSGSNDILDGDGVFYTRVRAKPVDFFDGDWSEWSSTASFSVKKSSAELLKVTSLSSLHITIGFSVFLVLVIISGVLLWRMHIKGYFTSKHPAPESSSRANAQGEIATHIMLTVPAQSLDACGPSSETQTL